MNRIRMRAELIATVDLEAGAGASWSLIWSRRRNGSRQLIVVLFVYLRISSEMFG